MHIRDRTAAGMEGLAAVVEKAGNNASDEIRRIRVKLDLSQAEAGEIFGGGVNAFSRYERGETMQPRALDQLLRLLDKHPKQLKELIAA